MTNGGSGGILDSQMFSQASGEDGDAHNASDPPRPPLVTIHEEEEEENHNATSFKFLLAGGIAGAGTKYPITA